MNEAFFAELSAWLTEAGLASTPETAIVSGFCDRCVAAGLPLARGLLFIDTLHPVHEGRLFRWGYSPAEAPLLEYGRTSPDALAASGFNPRDVEIAERWRRSPHYRMLQTGKSFWRRRLDGTGEDEFSVMPEWRAEGITDYVAIITRFATEGAARWMACTQHGRQGTQRDLRTNKLLRLSASCRTWDLPLNQYR